MVSSPCLPIPMWQARRGKYEGMEGNEEQDQTRLGTQEEATARLAVKGDNVIGKWLEGSKGVVGLIGELKVLAKYPSFYWVEWVMEGVEVELVR